MCVCVKLDPINKVINTTYVSFSLSLRLYCISLSAKTGKKVRKNDLIILGFGLTSFVLSSPLPLQKASTVEVLSETIHLDQARTCYHAQSNCV